MTLLRKATCAIASTLVIAALMPAGAAAKSGGDELPFRGHDTGIARLNLLTNHYELERVGTATHFGRYAATVEGNGAWNEAHTVFASTGTFVITTASADEIFGTLVAEATEFTESGHTSTAVLTVTGGTGRFAGAGGTVTVIDQDKTLSLVGPILTNETSSTYSGFIDLNREP